MKRTIWSVAGVIGVVAVALLAALVAGGGSDADSVDTVAASGQSNVTVVVAPTSSLPVMAVTSSTPGVSLGTQTVERRTTTSTAPAATPTTSATTVPATTTTTAAGDNAARPGPACAPSMFSATVTMSKPSYALTEPVRGTSTFRNVSGQTCYWSSDMGGFDILDASGASVVTPAIRIADAFRWVAFPSGDAKTETWTWDQRICRGSSPCVAAPAGQYTFVVDLQPYGSGRSPFAITA